MKFNFRKIDINQIILFISIVVISMWLFRLSRERYEETQIGPSIESAAKDKKMTQAELDAVLKFINQ